MKYAAHDKKCYACGRERKKALLGYDPKTLKTYCIHREECPNSSDIPSVILHELTTESFNDMVIDTYGDEIFGALDKMLGKSVSLRLKPALAMHLLKIMQEHDLFSINEALLYVLNRDLEQKEITAPLEEVNIEVYTPRPLVPYTPEEKPTYETYLTPEEMEQAEENPDKMIEEVTKEILEAIMPTDFAKELDELKRFKEEYEAEKNKQAAKAIDEQVREILRPEPEPEPEPIEEPKEEEKEPEEDDEWEI